MSITLGRIDFGGASAVNFSQPRSYETGNPTGGRTIATLKGLEAEQVSMDIFINETTLADSQVKREQLIELARNPDIDFFYLQSSVDSNLNGFYALTSAAESITPTAHSSKVFPVSCSLIRVGKPNYIRALQCNKLARTTDYGLTAQSIHGFPYGASVYLSSGSTYNRTGEDGAVPVVKDATNQDLFLYNLAESDINKGDVVVYDDMNDVEANWVEVLGPDHEFTGDVVIENSLIRIKTKDASANGKLVLSYWDGSAWTSATEIYYNDASNSIDYSSKVPTLAIGKISPEESEVILTFPNQTPANNPRISIKLARGRWDAICKVTFITGSAPSDFRVYLSPITSPMRYVKADAQEDCQGQGDGWKSTATMNTNNFFVTYDTATTYYSGLALVDNTGIAPYYSVASNECDGLFAQVANYAHSIFAVAPAGGNDTPEDLGKQLLMETESIPILVAR